VAAFSQWLIFPHFSEGTRRYQRRVMSEAYGVPDDAKHSRSLPIGRLGNYYLKARCLGCSSSAWADALCIPGLGELHYTEKFLRFLIPM
jgi:hypothetical protein